MGGRESYRLFGDDALSGRSLRARGLLHGHGVGIPGGLLGRGGFLLVGLEEVEHYGCCMRVGWYWFWGDVNR